MVFTSRVLAALDQADLFGDIAAKSEIKPQQCKPIHSFFTDKPSSSTVVGQLKTNTKLGKKSSGGDAGEKPAVKKTILKHQKLPKYSYRTYKPAPVIVYTRDEGEADDIVQTMRGPLGFDMEWRCLFRNGARISRKTALVQLCDNNIILLVQLSAMKKFPQEIKKVVESQDIIKLGVNIRSDGEKLFHDYGVFAANLVELSGLANQVDPLFATRYKRPMVSLVKMVEFYEQRLLSKESVRTSNWETVPLTEEQLEYAANDAHCALMIYKNLKTIAETIGRRLDPTGCASDLGKQYKAGKLTLNLPSYLSAERAGDTISKEAEPRPQQLRAYNFWHHRQMGLPEICATLRSKDNPLKESTVISYVVRALQADSSLPFDKVRLKDLVYQELGSWSRHGTWLMEMEKSLP